jgi:hypothetical protein
MPARGQRKKCWPEKKTITCKPQKSICQRCRKPPLLSFLLLPSKIWGNLNRKPKTTSSGAKISSQHFPTGRLAPLFSAVSITTVYVLYMSLSWNTSFEFLKAISRITYTEYSVISSNKIYSGSKNNIRQFCILHSTHYICVTGSTSGQIPAVFSVALCFVLSYE